MRHGEATAVLWVRGESSRKNSRKIPCKYIQIRERKRKISIGNSVQKSKQHIDIETALFFSFHRDNCDMTVSYINLTCERAADLKRDRTNERPLRKPKPQKCSIITMKSV